MKAPVVPRPPAHGPRRRSDSGFALLLVFLMAGILAITLYKEIPRVAFEAQRQKEQLLIERGEQYKRAIQVFVRKNNRWPAKIEDLENTNNQRFLRRRYVDPMTGKDEWRMIHIANGVLTDSKTTKQPGQDKKVDWQTSLGEVAGLGQTLSGSGQPGSGGVNLANRRRDSDNNPNMGRGAMAGDPNAPPLPGGMPNGGPTGPNGLYAGGNPGQPGMPPLPPGVGGIPGQQLPGGGRGVPQPGAVPGATGTTGASGGGSSYLGGGGSYLGSGSYLGGGSSTPNPTGTGQPPTGVPGQTGFNQPGFPPGNPVNSNGASPYQTNPGGNGAPPNFPQPGVTINPQGQNAAAQMIGNLLTQPRPGGMPVANTNGMQTMGAGIAGFASNADEDSIMVYNDHTNYGEWEFIFDPAKVKQLANPNSGAIGTPASQMGQQIGTPGTQVGTPAGGMGTGPFGQQGQPFGGQPGGFGTPGMPTGGGRQQ